MTKQYIQYDKDKIKEGLSLSEVSNLLAHFGGNPEIVAGDIIVSQSICHNPFGEGSRKLYYYDNTKLFRCYTGCGEMFDIYDLVMKVHKEKGEDWPLPRAIQYVAEYFGHAGVLIEESGEELPDWRLFDAYDRIQNISIERKEVELKVYNETVLNNFTSPIILPWEQEGIDREVMRQREIKYNPLSGGIVIPHRDLEGRLIGIRERTLLTEQAEKYGKYMPSIVDGVMYRHPLSYNLYGLDKSKENISLMEMAIVVEGEKSVLKYESFFGIENSLVCATCGSSLINYQVQILSSLGVKEIVVGFDKDFKERGDDDFNKVVKKLVEINRRYGAYVKISFLFDGQEDLLKYKDSPLDQGPEVFLELFRNRIVLTKEEGRR